jgi:hypothetical protein
MHDTVTHTPLTLQGRSLNQRALALLMCELQNIVGSHKSDMNLMNLVRIKPWKGDPYEVMSPDKNPVQSCGHATATVSRRESETSVFQFPNSHDLG